MGHQQSKLDENSSKRLLMKLNAKSKDVEEEEYEEEEEEDGEYEYEYEYEEYEEEEYEEEYEEEEGEDAEEVEIIPLQDDPDDPNYTAQKALVEETVERSRVLNEVREATTGEGAGEFFESNIQQFLDEQIEKAGATEKVEEIFEKLQITEMDEKTIEEEIKKQEEMEEGMSDSEIKLDFLKSLGSGPDAFPSDDDPLLASRGEDGLKNDDLQKLQSSLENLVGVIQESTDGTAIDNKQAMIRPQYELENLDQQTLDEISMCLNASATDINGMEYGETIKAEDPLRWLLYDLDFNVTNLMLASCLHNPESPLLLNHWMPQLCAYSRYADVRDREFRFTWDDAKSADVGELLRYYQGLGYDEIPKPAPKETNIVELETEYDQEDMTMAAFENWMNEVYNDENENLYFDDEDFQPEHNVFDHNYGLDENDEVTGFRAEFADFQQEHANETQQWRDRFAKETNYTAVHDKEAQEEFRGHLVIACCGSDQDLELSETITGRMKDEFGKKVHVETRVYSHARQMDNLYEIWLESYDIELIHSRREAFYNNKQWNGPADVDDKQLDYIVEQVRYMISDDARYSYHIHEFVQEV